MSAAAPALATAAAQGLASCHTCGLLLRWTGAHGACPRCDAPVHLRKPTSLASTTALALAAAILYIPANLYPVMTVTMLGKGEPDTILTGVINLWHAGMWSLALLVFFASIAVPLLKLLGIACLVSSVWRRSRWRPADRTRLYRVVEAVGRWSMVDIFVLSILVALVRLGNLATIEPGLGATAFCSVVVITMIAATRFDPRLIWDALESEETT